MINQDDDLFWIDKWDNVILTRIRDLNSIKQ